jgi:hypothetical protein
MKAISIPITILTKKKPGRTDSLFYSGKDIAEVSVGSRVYVLGTAGFYKFELQSGKAFSGEELADVPAVRRLTDRSIRKIKDPPNWGWFAYRLLVDNSWRDVGSEAYFTYDEAMEAFVTFIKNDLLLK